MCISSAPARPTVDSASELKSWWFWNRYRFWAGENLNRNFNVFTRFPAAWLQIECYNLMLCAGFESNAGKPAAGWLTLSNTISIDSTFMWRNFCHIKSSDGRVFAQHKMLAYKLWHTLCEICKYCLLAVFSLIFCLHTMSNDRLVASCWIMRSTKYDGYKKAENGQRLMENGKSKQFWRWFFWCFYGN